MRIAGLALVPGHAAGAICRLREPLSFWGGYESRTGTIIDRRHPDHGRSCAGQILMMRASRGSSSGSSVLAEAIRAATAPLGIILAERDAIVTVGAMVALELYQRACPVVLLADADWDTVAAARSVSIEAGDNGATITIDEA
jgi:predicted aconitase with swiveling domain